MKTSTALLVLTAAGVCGALPCSQTNEILPSDLVIVPRAGWNARPPTSTQNMSNPVLYVVIHHSYTPPACTTPEDCEEAMRIMQNMHMDDNNWADIGYNFAAGGDGRIYEGRGWSHMGAHAPGYNDRSIGICTIGDWTDEVPPAAQLDAIMNLIEYGIAVGRVTANYRVIGHRQARPTECPGEAYYEAIKRWPHWEASPNFENLSELFQMNTDI